MLHSLPALNHPVRARLGHALFVFVLCLAFSFSGLAMQKPAVPFHADLLSSSLSPNYSLPDNKFLTSLPPMQTILVEWTSDASSGQQSKLIPYRGTLRHFFQELESAVLPAPALFPTRWQQPQVVEQRLPSERGLVVFALAPPHSFTA